MKSNHYLINGFILILLIILSVLSIIASSSDDHQPLFSSEPYNPSISEDNTNDGSQNNGGTQDLNQNDINISDLAQDLRYALSLEDFKGKQNILTTESNEPTILDNQEWGDNFVVKVKVTDEKTKEKIIPNLKVQWRAHNQRIEFIVYDPERKWSSAIFQNDLSEEIKNTYKFKNSILNRSNSNEERYLGPISTILLTISVGLLLTEEIKEYLKPYKYLEGFVDVYKMDKKIGKITNNSEGFGCFFCSIEEFSMYLAKYYENKRFSLLIANKFITTTDYEWEPLELYIHPVELKSITEALTKFIVDKLNEVEDYDLYGSFVKPDTKIWILKKSWLLNSNEYFNADFSILPLKWDDSYEENDTFESAKFLNSKNTTALCVDKDYPDYFLVYLNSGDFWDAYINSLEENIKKLNLKLYDINKKLICHNIGYPNKIVFENIEYSGLYFLEVALEENIWVSDRNLYELNVSNINRYDAFEENDDFENAWNLEEVNSNGFLIYNYDPDYFQIYLFSGDSFSITASLMTEGIINLALYDPSYDDLDNSNVLLSSVGDFKSIYINNINISGIYYIEITRADYGWFPTAYNFSEIGWDDQYEDNDDFSQSLNINDVDPNGLLVSNNDPDYFYIDSNIGDSLNVTVTLKSEGAIKFSLYNQNYHLIKAVSLFGVNDSGSITVSNINVPKRYHIEIIKEGNGWLPLRYNIEVIIKKETEYSIISDNGEIKIIIYDNGFLKDDA